MKKVQFVLLKYAVILFAAFLLVVSSQAQTPPPFMSITAAQIHGTNGPQLLPQGQMSWQAVDNTGAPISYQVGGGGQSITFPTICTITNGSIALGCQVANTAITNPLNICFIVTVTNQFGQIVMGGPGPGNGYQCVQPNTSNYWCTSGSCNFDQYTPNLGPAILALLAPPTTLSLGGLYAQTCSGSQFSQGVDLNGRQICGSPAGSGTITGVTAGTGLSGGGTSGGVSLAIATPVAIANGGTGTNSPSLVGGTNVTISGSWPNQTVNVSGGGPTLGTAAQFPVMNAGATAYVPVTLTQDCIINSTGVITCTKTNNVAFAASATTDTTNAGNISSGTLSAARLPAPTATTLGGVESYTAVAHQWINAVSTGGIHSSTQPACADISNSSPSCSTDTTNASNISSGTLGASRLPNPGASTLGGIESYAPVTNQWINSISTSGVPSSTQPACGSLSNAAASCSTDTTNANNISSGLIALARGGTGAGTQGAAAINIFPTPTRAGDVAIWNGTAWITVPGNNSGTQYLQETSSGVGSWSTPTGAGNVNAPSSAVINDIAGFANTAGTLLFDTNIQSGNVITDSGNLTQYGVALASGNKTLTSTGAGATNTVLLGNGSANPSFGQVSNAALVNSTIGIGGTANQITSSISIPALGGSTTLAIANPFVFPGKQTAAASTISAAALNIPSGSVPSSPVSGDLSNISGILEFYDGTHTNSLTTIQSAPTSGHLAIFSGTSGLLADGGTLSAFQVNTASLSSAGTVNFENSSATNGVTLTVSNPSAGNVQLGISGTLNNAGLTNSSLTLSCPSIFTCGSVSLGGTLTVNFAGSQTANEFLASPNGSSGAVSLRTIVGADLPATVVNGPNSSTSNDIPVFANGSGNSLSDSGVLYANLTTQSTNGAVNEVCTYTGTNKTCVPGLVTNAMLANSSISIGGAAVSLGGSTSSFPSPGPIGGTTPSTGIFSALTDTAMTGGPFCVHETTGVFSATTADCGSGGGPALGTAAQIPVMNSGATAYAPQSISGDSTLTAVGVMTNTGLQGHALATLALGYPHWNGSIFSWDTPSGTVSPATQGQPVTCTGSGCGSTPISTDATQFSGADMCAKIANAITAANTSNALNVEARGFSGIQVCSAANAKAMLAGMTQGGDLWLGQVQLYFPMGITAAGSFGSGSTAATPPTGTVVKPNLTRIHGMGSSAISSSTYNTVIGYCTGTVNQPVTGCPSYSPPTDHFAITSTALVYNATYDRAYLHVVGSGMDLVGKVPVLIESSSQASNNGSWTVCEIDKGLGNSGTAGGVSARVDPGCPANPTATDVYLAVPSGIVAATTSAPGTISITGGSPFITPSLTATSGTTIFIKNPGQYGAAPTLTCTNTGGTCTVALMTACSASCGNIHGEIPIIDDGPAPALNAFSEELDHLVLDCHGVPDSAGFRSLYANEMSSLHDVNILACPTRGIDYHTFNEQNSGHVQNVRVAAGSALTSCFVGTEGGYFGDVGPHGLQDVTMDFTSCSSPVNAGIRIEADDYPMYILGGHSENALWGIACGQSGPCFGLTTTNWAGQPQANLATVDGAYKNQQQAAIKVFTNYQLPVNTSVATTDYAFRSTKLNHAASSGYTIADDLNNYYISDTETIEYAYDGGQGNQVGFLGTCSTCIDLGFGFQAGAGGVMTPLLIQTAANKFAGVSACSSSTKAITFTAFNSQPVILVFDETTKGGVNLSSKSVSGFTVSCTGASDVFDWQVIGDPN